MFSPMALLMYEIAMETRSGSQNVSIEKLEVGLGRHGRRKRFEYIWS